VTPLAEITIADPHFETLLTDCLGQFWKWADEQKFTVWVSLSAYPNA
jgi:hypothetical protein